MNDFKNPFLEQEIDLREYLRILYERRWLIISFTLILCTLSLIRSFMMKPIYNAETRILIEREEPHVVKIEEVSSSDFSGREYYQTQYRILKSRAIAERVDKSLGEYTPWSEWKGRKDARPLTGQQRAEALLKRIAIKPLPNTQLVEINVEDINPQLAAKIANLWAETYISYVLDTKFDATQYASGWLQEKIKEAKKNLEGSELELQKYRKEKSILDTGSEKDDPAVLNELLKRRAEIEIEISEKSEYFKEKHPEIIGLKSELGSVNKKINSETDSEIFMKDKAIQYNILKREVESNKEIYESLLERIRETEVTGELKTTNIRIIDKAPVPLKPHRPRKKFNLIIAFLIGICASSGLAFILESLDQTLKNPEDIKNHLKLASLASIALPREAEDKNAKPELISSERPNSTISESYRSLRTSIMFTSVEHKRKTILFTSSGPQEGKTTTAINLAIVMAQAGEKVLLLDGDLRQPRVEKIFNFSIEHGITEVLAKDEKLSSVIHKTDIKNLDLIACGAIPPNPSELLGSRKMRNLLKELETRYDRIIIDAPPTLAVTDPVVLAQMVDGTVLVVRAGETNRNAVLKAKEIIQAVKGSSLIGAVLAMVEQDKTGGHYYYYRYYGKKYGHYGQEKKKT